MICAHTVRRLRPGTFDDFRDAFMPDTSNPPKGWVRFVMLRNHGNPDEVVTFGFFDGTVEEMESNQDDHRYAERVKAIAPYVDEVVVNGVYDVAVDLKAQGAMA
jgi:hypothetical protein